MTERSPWKVIRSNLLKSGTIFSATINCAITKGTFTAAEKATIARVAKVDGITNVSVEFFAKKHDDEVAIILYSLHKDAIISATQALVDASIIGQSAAEEIRTKADKAA